MSGFPVVFGHVTPMHLERLIIVFLLLVLLIISLNSVSREESISFPPTTEGPPVDGLLTAIVVGGADELWRRH